MKHVDITRQKIIPSARVDTVGLEVFVVSDLHTEYEENMAWLKGLPKKGKKKEVLLVAGDVAETYEKFVLTMSLLKASFEHVFFVPGNHDLWLRREKENYVSSLSSYHSMKILFAEFSSIAMCRIASYVTSSCCYFTLICHGASLKLFCDIMGSCRLWGL